MTRHHWVSQTQVEAAKLVVEMDLEDGREPDPVALAMSKATPMPQPRDADGKLLKYIDLPD